MMKCRYTEPELSVLGRAGELADAWLPLSSDDNALGRLSQSGPAATKPPVHPLQRGGESTMKCAYAEPELNVIGRVEELTEFFLGGYQDHVSGRLF